MKKGEDSIEFREQPFREESILCAVYLRVSEIPKCPREPPPTLNNLTIEDSRTLNIHLTSSNGVKVLDKTLKPLQA